MTLVTNRRLRWAMSAVCTMAMGAGLSACETSHTSDGMEAKSTSGMKSNMDIIQTATGPGMQDVTTLVSLVQEAGLVDTLKGPGPFTVFAPTNEAFAMLPKATLDDLQKPENKDKLKAILLYHVHPGDAIMAADCKTMGLSTADGSQMLHVVVADGKVMVNNATVIKPNIVCSNGVIHWVDKVILPPNM